MMNNPNAYFQIDHVTQRIGEQPKLVTAFESEGMNVSSVVGIATDNPEVDPNSWTLLDQFGNPRTPQTADRIGFSTGANKVEVLGFDGSVAGEAHLVTLENGWEAVTP